MHANNNTGIERGFDSIKTCFALGTLEKPVYQPAAWFDAEFCRCTGNYLHYRRHFPARTD
jgi:hypothetical protein